MSIFSTIIFAGLGAIIMWMITYLHSPKPDEKKLAIGVIVVCTALLCGLSYTFSAAQQRNMSAAIIFAETSAYEEGFEAGLKEGLEAGFEDGFSEGRYWACKVAEEWLTPNELDSLDRQLKDIY